MTNYDRTRENIGASKLDEKTKKELFNKFVDAGGQVVQEKKKSGLSDFDRDKQAGYRRKIEDHQKTLQDKRPTPAAARQAQAGRKAASRQSSVAAQPPAGEGSFLDRIVIRFKLFFGGIAEFYNPYFKRSFIEKFNAEYKSALLEAQMIFFDVFRQNPVQGREIMSRMDKIKPLYYELIEMLSGVYDRVKFLPITEAHENFPNVPQKIIDHEDFMLELFKRLYVLRAYPAVILDSFERAIEMQMSLEKRKASVYAAKRKKIRNDVYIVFNKLLPRLYWIFCRSRRAVIPMADPSIEKILGITAEDRPGRRTADQPPAEIEIPVPESAQPQEEEAAAEEELHAGLPDEVKRGLEMMYRLDMQKLREEIDQKNPLKSASESDKMLMAYLLLREFDHEYSFILTTNKIKYNVLYDTPVKVDYRGVLSDMYNQLRDCFESLSQYGGIVDGYEKARLDKPVSNEQYLSYSKKLTLMEKTRTQSGHKTRLTIKSFMEKISETLRPLIADMEGPQKIVGNPQDILEFDSGIEGKKKLNGKKIYESIYTAYAYASAFAWRLSTEGDLAGHLEFREGEIKQPAGPAGEEPAPEATPAPAPVNNQPAKQGAAKQKPAENGEQKSVIGELEDLF